MRASLASLGIAAVFVLPISPARAGQYPVLACSQAPAAANESWAPFDSDPVHIEVGRLCPPAPGSSESDKTAGMYASDVLGSSGVAPVGSLAGWRFIAPAGTEIVAVQDDRFLGAYADRGWVPFVKADGVTLETCTFSTLEEGCTVGGLFGDGSLDGVLPVAEASTLTVGIRCVTAGGCTTGATIHRAWAALYGAKVTLATEAPPALESATGGLWDANGKSTYHKGTESLAYNATALTGVSAVGLSVDGRETTRATGRCDYARPLPCEPLTGTLSLDTTQLADGVHTLSLEATDAAGDTERLSGSLAVANLPPPSPLRVAVMPAADGSFTVGWDDPPDPTPITGVQYQLCDATGSNCGSVASFRNAPFALGSAAAGGTVRIWLTDAAGNTNPASASVASVPLSPGNGRIVTPIVVTTVGSIKLQAHIKHERLSMTVTGSRGIVGSVHVAVEAVRRSGKHFGRRSASTRLVRGVARFSFRLGPRTLQAIKLVIRATATHAHAARKVLTLARAKAQAGIPPELLGR
jgi:hypothetical protein